MAKMTISEQVAAIKKKSSEGQIPSKIQSALIDRQFEAKKKEIESQDRKQRFGEAVRRTQNMPQAFGEQLEKLTPEPIKQKVKQFVTEAKDYGKYVGSSLAKKAIDVGENISHKPKEGSHLADIFDTTKTKDWLEQNKDEAIKRTPSMTENILKIPYKKDIAKGLGESINYLPSPVKKIVASAAENLMTQGEDLTKPATIAEIAAAGAIPGGPLLFAPDLAKGVKEGGKKAYAGFKARNAEDVGAGVGEIIGAGAGLLGVTKGAIKGGRPKSVPRETIPLLEAPVETPPPRTPVLNAPQKQQALPSPKAIQKIEVDPRLQNHSWQRRMLDAPQKTLELNPGDPIWRMPAPKMQQLPSAIEKPVQKTPFYSEAKIEPFQKKILVKKMAPVESASVKQIFKPFKPYNLSDVGESFNLGKNQKEMIGILENEIKSAKAGSRSFSYDAKGQGSTPDVVGIPSTFPIQNLGGKERQLKIIEKVKSGEALTESESGVFSSMMDWVNDKRAEIVALKRAEPLESRIANKFEFGDNQKPATEILGKTEQVPTGFTADIAQTKTVEKAYPKQFSAQAQKTPAFKPKITKGGAEFPEIKDYVDDVFNAVKSRINNERGSIDFTKEVDPLKAEAYKYADEMLLKEAQAKDSKASKYKKGFQKLGDEVVTNFVDEAYPIESAVKRSQKNMQFAKNEVTPFERVRYSIDRVYRAKSLAGQFMKDGGLNDIIQKAPNLDMLDQYLKAKRSLELVKNFKTKKQNALNKFLEAQFLYEEAKKNGSINQKINDNYTSTKSEYGKIFDLSDNPSGRDILKDQFFVEQMGPEYEVFAKEYNAYNKKFIQYLVDSDLISSKMAKDLIDSNPDYVPFNRIIDEVNTRLPSERKIAHLDKQTVIQKIKGSELPIENVFESTVTQTLKAFTEGERNKSARALYNASLRLPEFAEVFQEVAQNASIPHSVDFLDEGVKRRFATTKEIASSAKNLEPEQINTLLRILNTPVRWFKTGTTGINPVFIFRNVPRDFQTAIINSEHGYKLLNPKALTEAVFAIAKHNDFFDELVRQGALNTSYDTYRTPEISVKKIRAGKSFVSKAKYTASNPSELLSAVEDIVGMSEQFPRATIYKTAIESYKKQGFSEADARVKATIDAQWKTANFLRKGKWGQVIGSLFPYLRAGIQGQRVKISSARSSPLSYGMKTAGTILLPTIALTAWALSDKKRSEAYFDIMDYEKEGNFTIIPPNPKKDPVKNQWNAVTIPIAQSWQSEQNIVREIMENIFKKDPIEAMKVFNDIVGIFSPMKPESSDILGGLTPVLKAPLEAEANYKFFARKPIVGPRMARQPKVAQYYPWTPETIKKFSNFLGTSPIKTEEFIKSFMGSVEPQVFNLIDRGLSSAGVLSADNIGGKSTLEAIKEAFLTAQGGQQKQNEYKETREKDELLKTKKFLKKERKKSK